MNYIQALIDRQLGIYNRLTYDHILKRLVVREDESFYALQTSEAAAAAAELDHDPPIFACRFAECRGYEHLLALANEDGRVAIQDTSKTNGTGTLEGFQCHNNAVFDLAWMPANMNFVTVSGDHTACLWDVADGTPKRTLTFSSHTKSVKTAVFRLNEPSVFATGARDGHILVWDIRASNQPSGIVLKPDNCLMNCHSSFTPKTPGSHSKRPRIDNQRAISITGLVFQDDVTLLSCGECDGNIKVWDLRKSYSTFTREPLPKHSIPYCGSSTRNGYTNLILDDARIRLYASCMDDVIYCFNVATYNALPERRYVGHENRTFYIKTALSPDCAYLVSGSSDTNAYVWNVKRRSQPVARLAGHRAEVTCAAWRRAGDTALVTCSDDARHKLWRVGPELADARDLRGRAEDVPADTGGARWHDGHARAGKRPAAARAAHHAPHHAPRALARPAAKRCLAHDMQRAHAAKRARPAAGDAPPDAPPEEQPPAEARAPKRPRARTPEPLTRDLPDFVLRGEAPHLRLMSPAKKRAYAADWLTQLARRRARPAPPGAAPPAPPGPAPPAPRSPARVPPPSARTLFKYFSVAEKK